MHSELKKYKLNFKKLNNSFEEELIFPLTNRGFYSEINNLVLAALYCSVHKINIKISSRNWVAGQWSDYFNPIIEEYKGIIPVPTFSVFFIRRREKLFEFYHKNLKKRQLVQYNIWSKIGNKTFTESYFNIPELGINGDIFHAKKRMMSILFDINSTVNNELRGFMKQHNTFIKDSCGIHVRRGDKVFEKHKEADFISLSDFVNKATTVAPELNKFTICTDDYDVIEEFKEEFPQFDFFTLCKNTNRGYSQKEYNSITDKKKIYNEVLDLLKDSYLLTHSKVFIGSYSSNISRFLVLQRDDINCYSMDSEWYPN